MRLMHKMSVIHFDPAGYKVDVREALSNDGFFCRLTFLL